MLMQFTLEQLAHSKQKIAYCQQHGVTPLLSYALLRHFSPNHTYSSPLISVAYASLYALSAASSPRTLESLFVIALKHLRNEVQHRPHNDAKYTCVERDRDSYKARFSVDNTIYVFHLMQREPEKWSMTLCYADDD